MEALRLLAHCLVFSAAHGSSRDSSSRHLQRASCQQAPQCSSSRCSASSSGSRRRSSSSGRCNIQCGRASQPRQARRKHGDRAWKGAAGQLQGQRSRPPLLAPAATPRRRVALRPWRQGRHQAVAARQPLLAAPGAAAPGRACSNARPLPPQHLSSAAMACRPHRQHWQRPATVTSRVHRRRCPSLLQRKLWARQQPLTAARQPRARLLPRRQRRPSVQRRISHRRGRQARLLRRLPWGCCLMQWCRATTATTSDNGQEAAWCVLAVAGARARAAGMRAAAADGGDC